ncbi:MAG: hypothetical protein WBB76_10810 [Gaiellaceae bacterium]
MARSRLALLACCAAAVLTGCSSSSQPTVRIAPARTFALTGFKPTRIERPGTTRLSFTIRQPSGSPLTTYRRGAGPHTGVHVIVVRRDLGVIIHRHPPIGPNGRIVQAIDFPAPGPYRVLVDAYPAVNGAPRNFQLHEDVRVAGAYRPQRLPAFSPTATVDGYRVVLSSPRRLHAIEPAHLTASVTDPAGRPVAFRPWYGALAHAIFFREGSLDYFHTHVCGPSTPGCTSILGGTRVVGRSTTPGKLQVGVLLPVSGTWRLFLQFQAGGRILTAPFTLSVR